MFQTALLLIKKKSPPSTLWRGDRGRGRLMILSGLRGMLINPGGSYFHQGLTPRSIWPRCSWWWMQETWPLSAPSSFLAPTSAVCNHQSSCTSDEVHTVCWASPDWLKIKLHCYSSSDIMERLNSFCWHNDDITCWKCVTAGIKHMVYEINDIQIKKKKSLENISAGENEKEIIKVKSNFIYNRCSLLF